MKKVLELFIENNNLRFVIDESIDINNLLKFVRLSFSHFEVNGNLYKIYYESIDKKSHNILLTNLSRIFVRYKKDNTILTKVSIYKRSNIIIDIFKSHTLDALHISFSKISSKEFKIALNQEKKVVFNYLKNKFLLDILDMKDKEIIVSFNNETKDKVLQIANKKNIMGFKVDFFVDSEFNFHKRTTNTDSLKEYLTKIKRAMELFEIKDISEFDMAKKRFRKLAKRYHPDLHSNKPELIKKIYEKKFIKIKTSYELLEEYYKKRY